MFPSSEKSPVTQLHAGARLKSVTPAAPAGLHAAVSFHGPLLCTDISERGGGGAYRISRDEPAGLRETHGRRNDTVGGTLFMRTYFQKAQSIWGVAQH